MVKIEYDAKYFNPEQTLDCGQVFRFERFKDGYFIVSGGKACYLHTQGNKTIAECEDGDYFYNYFDLARDYAPICGFAANSGFELLEKSAKAYCGLRLLNQDREEMIYSFIISQNNNIPRIKGIISRICAGLGQKSEFLGREYYTFPTTYAMAQAGGDFFKAAGCGYRDKFLSGTALRLQAEGLAPLEGLPTPELKKQLLTYAGIGPKVADCIALFGFSRRDSFPVDTWVEKVYREDFKGTLTDRNKICQYFLQLFGENSGYMQQYLFYGKRKNL